MRRLLYPILLLALLASLPALALGPVGTNHPASGPFAQVAAPANSAWPLGASYSAGEGSTLQVAVASANANAMLLEIYTNATGSDAAYDYWMTKGADNVWRAAVASVPGKTLYAFRAWGPNWPFTTTWARGNSSAGFVTDVDANGNRFNPNKVLYDPYARELSHDKSGVALATAGESTRIFGSGGANISAAQTYTGAITGYRSTDLRAIDSGRYAPKAVALVDATSFGAHPRLAEKDSAIYETHLKGLTAHPSSVNLVSLLSKYSGFSHAANVPDALRGTYAGAGYMAGYLKDLGYTTVEFLPIHETDNDTTPTTHSGGNYWGYMTYGFFAPDRHYAHDQSLGGPTREFKQMVQAFHDAGLEVYLDVVYNHSGEGGNWDTTTAAAELTCFRGLDNAGYYALSGSTNNFYFETTGCGNNLDASKPVVKSLVKDSLLYWATQMGVDGFRFDLAPVLGRDQAPGYAFNGGAQLLTDIASLASSNGFKVVAEAWDLGVYAVGGFPAGWAEWNGRYRDAVRRYLKGDASGAGGINYADAFYGDQGHFAGHGGPQKTVNMITAHDGFTLTDLVSFNAKNNARAWPFGPSDGGNDSNDSSDWGQNQALRRQVVRNFETFQIFSRGIPMQVWGDEFGRTVNGNNNAYNVDSVATWNNYAMLATDSPDTVATGDLSGGTEGYFNVLGSFTSTGRNANFQFIQSLLNFRQAHPALRAGDYTVPITFSKLDGSAGFNGYSDLMARIQIQGSAVGDSDFLVLSNMYGATGSFSVPAAPVNTHWVRIVDTHAWAEGSANFWSPSSGATISGSYGVNPFSIVVLMAVVSAPPPPPPSGTFTLVLKAGGNAENVKFPGDFNNWNINTTQALSVAANGTGSLAIPSAVTAANLALGNSTTALELQVINVAGGTWSDYWNFATWSQIGCTVPDTKQITIPASTGQNLTLTIDIPTRTLTATVQ